MQPHMVPAPGRDASKSMHGDWPTKEEEGRIQFVDHKEGLQLTPSLLQDELKTLQFWIQTQLLEQTQQMEKLITTCCSHEIGSHQASVDGGIHIGQSPAYVLESIPSRRSMTTAVDGVSQAVKNTGGIPSDEDGGVIGPSPSSFMNVKHDLLGFLFKTARQPVVVADAEGEGTSKTPNRRSARQLEWDEKMRRRLKAASATVRTKTTVEMPETMSWRFIHGSFFAVIVAFMIGFNAIAIGFDVEDGMTRALHHPEDDRPAAHVHLNTFFTVFFSVELAARLVTERLYFFLGKYWQWNLFDSMLVIMSLIDVLAADGLDLTKSSSAGYLRVIKNIRLVRVLRIVRLLRFFRELRRMCMSILSAISSLAWAMLFLFVIIYVFAIFFMQAGIERLRDEVVQDDIAADWDRFYGSMGDTIFSLTKAITGGEDWAPMTEPLKDASLGYVLLFTFYVIFVIFGVLNVLTGVFLGSAAEVLLQDRDWVTQDEHIKVKHFVKNFHALFTELDISRDGSITWNEFCSALQEKETQAFFIANGLDLGDAHLVFNLIADESHEIKVDDFVQGCSKLTGAAKSLQVIALLKEAEGIKKEVAKLSRHISSLAPHEKVPPAPIVGISVV